MKKALFIVLVLGLIVGLSMVAMAGVSNTPHDPRITGVSGNATRICEYCHVPHSGIALAYPLWNRNRNYANYVFTNFYTSPSFDMGPEADTALGYQSRLCFSCHDGALSTPQVVPPYDVSADYTTLVAASASIINADLTGYQHPVGFVVNLSLDTGGSGLNTLSNNAAQINGNTGIRFPLFNTTSNTSTMQCATCHSVHDTESYVGKGVNTPYFLRASNYLSAMCAECHPLYY